MSMYKNNWPLISVVLGCMLLCASVIATAQSGSDNTQGQPASTQDQPANVQDQQTKKQDDQTKIPEEPVRTNTDSYAVSLGTGQIISMSGQTADGEFIAGKLSKSKAPEFKNQFFYGFSASSVYTDSFAGVGQQSLHSTSVSPYLAVLV